MENMTFYDFVIDFVGVRFFNSSPTYAQATKISTHWCYLMEIDFAIRHLRSKQIKGKNEWMYAKQWLLRNKDKGCDFCYKIRFV